MNYSHEDKKKIHKHYQNELRKVKEASAREGWKYGEKPPPHSVYSYSGGGSYKRKSQGCMGAALLLISIPSIAIISLALLIYDLIS